MPVEVTDGLDITVPHRPVQWRPSTTVTGVEIGVVVNEKGQDPARASIQECKIM